MKKILAVLDDLMFTVKINDLAKRAGLGVAFLKSEIDVLAQAKEKPAAVIIDLNAHSVNPVNLIASLKQDADAKSIPIVAYVSHVQAELKQKALEAGAEIVLARSAFSTNLPAILKRHAGAV